MNSKDLCLLDHLPDLIKSGVKSLKIEGRMKSVHYVATVVSVYRKAIDAYLRDPEHFSVLPEWQEELLKISHRPYTTGFLNTDRKQTVRSIQQVPMNRQRIL